MDASRRHPKPPVDDLDPDRGTGLIAFEGEDAFRGGPPNLHRGIHKDAEGDARQSANILSDFLLVDGRMPGVLGRYVL